MAKQPPARRVEAMLRRAMPDLHHATYVVIQEIPATAWGYDGKTQADRALTAN